MTRKFNFSAGPATLPEAVLSEIASELVDYQGEGCGVMEMSHRGPVYSKIHKEAKQRLIDLLKIPDTHEVLFMHGGASTQFSAIPFNLLPEGGKCDYIVTGDWSKKAAAEAKKYGDVHIAYEANPMDHFPTDDQLDIRPDAKYVYYCCNETIRGVEKFDVPAVPEGVELVCDWSSNLLSRPFDVSKYGLCYACAQKNFGPAGLTIVIVKKSLIGNPHPLCPTLLTYKTFADTDSLYNTPPSFNIYFCHKLFGWLQEFGGLEKMEAYNKEKADKLYSYLEANPDFWRIPVAKKECRSLMNVPFVCTKEYDPKEFLAFAAERGCVTLAGHRSIGGFRASIYNAMPMEGIETLVQALKDYQASKQ